MAIAQIILSLLIICGTFVMICICKLSAEQTALLETACLTVVYFWFNRQRTAGIPDASQVVTQEHTSPDGTRSVITSPAASTSVVAGPLSKTGDPA